MGLTVPVPRGIRVGSAVVTAEGETRPGVLVWGKDRILGPGSSPLHVVTRFAWTLQFPPLKLQSV